MQHLVVIDWIMEARRTALLRRGGAVLRLQGLGRRNSLPGSREGESRHTSSATPPRQEGAWSWGVVPGFYTPSAQPAGQTRYRFTTRVIPGEQEPGLGPSASQLRFLLPSEAGPPLRLPSRRAPSPDVTPTCTNELKRSM